MKPAFKNRWQGWTPEKTATTTAGRTDKTAERGAMGSSVSFGSGVRAAEASKSRAPDDESPRLDVVECFTLLESMHAEIPATYEPGALRWASTNVPELQRRFEATEAALEVLAAKQATEAEWRAALAAHVAVWREISDRYRAHKDRRA